MQARVARLQGMGIEMSDELPRGLSSTDNALFEAPEGTPLLLLHGES